MYIKRLILIVYTFYVIINSVFSQCETFRVFHLSGTVYKNSETIRTNIIIDDVLKNTDIFLEDNSHLILFSTEGVPVSLNQKGNYRFKDLQNICFKPDKSITDTYFGYIWDCITGKEVYEKDTIRAYTSRGKDIMMKFPCDSSVIISARVTFSWISIHNVETYYFKLADPAGRIVLDTALTDTSYSWFPDKEQASREGYYHWIVGVDENHPVNAVSFRFQFADKNWIVQYNKELEELNSGLYFNPAINMLLLAGFYDRHYLFQEAYESYSKALKMMPENINIIKMYSNFMQLKQLNPD
jgi:hypothetical protein